MGSDSDELLHLDAHLDPPEGEDLGSESVEQAERWVQFYGDLAAFETRVLATMVRLSASMPADRRRAVEESNIRPMQNLIASFERRAGLWLERLSDLSSTDRAPK